MADRQRRPNFGVPPDRFSPNNTVRPRQPQQQAQLTSRNLQQPLPRPTLSASTPFVGQRGNTSNAAYNRRQPNFDETSDLTLVPGVTRMEGMLASLLNQTAIANANYQRLQLEVNQLREQQIRQAQMQPHFVRPPAPLPVMHHAPPFVFTQPPPLQDPVASQPPVPPPRNPIVSQPQPSNSRGQVGPEAPIHEPNGTQRRVHNLTLPPGTEEDQIHETMHFTNDFHGFQAIPQVPPLTIQGQSRKLYDLPEFSGNAEEWPRFLAAFTETTRKYGYDDLENLIRLNKALKSPALDTVKTLLIHSANVGMAMDTLMEIYGDPETLVRDQELKLACVKVLAEEDFDGLCTFALKVRNMRGLFNATGANNQLSDVGLLRTLVSKLPPIRTREWLQYTSSIQEARRPDINDFCDWLDGLVRQIRRYNALYAPLKVSKGHPKGMHLVQASEKDEDVTLVQEPDTGNAPKASAQCFCCKKQDHALQDCQMFRDKDVEERWKYILERRLCFSCMKYGHQTRTCRRKKSCGTSNCTKPHHPMLHRVTDNDAVRAESSTNADAAPTAPTPTPMSPAPTRQITFHDQRVSEVHVMFRVVPVVLSNGNKEVHTYALFDEGSCLSFMHSSLANELGLTGEQDELKLTWFDNSVTSEKATIVGCSIRGDFPGAKTFKFDNVHATESMDLSSQTLSLEKLTGIYPLAQDLPIAEYTNAKPLIIIGLPHAHLTCSSKTIFLAEEGPMAAVTPLGWCLFGKVATKELQIKRPVYTISKVQSENESELQRLHEEFARYMEMDSFGVQKVDALLESNEDQRARSILETKTRIVDGRYESGLLWRGDSLNLPDNYNMALKRLNGLHKKFDKDPKLKLKYKEAIEDNIAKGYAQKLPLDEPERPGATWYIPHFAVVNPSKPKIRIVFDCAAKYGNVSLNDFLLRGPDLNQNLSKILFQFREGKIAVCGDIKEMFSQIKICKEDQDVQRFLWREDMNSPVEKLKMTSMLFGATSSPCTAQYVKNKNAERFANEYPEAVDAIKFSHYVDDYIKSFSNVQTAACVTNEIRKIHAQGGFELTKFISNSHEVLEQLEVMDVDITELRKVLGVSWLPSRDVFTFSMKPLDPRLLSGDVGLTRRLLLSIVMSVFDPFGFLAAFMITAKIHLQKTWSMEVSWDEELPAEFTETFRPWLKYLNQINELEIPRCYLSGLDEILSLQLHVLADAAEQALSNVAFWRIKTKDGIKCVFVNGKTKVAPKKLISVPRLELQAAVLGKRMKEQILVDHSMVPQQIFMWTDSKTVKLWLESEARNYRPFVAHRIAEILNSMEKTKWCWIPTKMNTADVGTRAVTDGNFEEKITKWHSAPEFLYDEPDTWPKVDDDIHEYEVIDEMKREFRIATVQIHSPLLNPERVGKYSILIRVVVCFQRAIKRFLSFSKSNTIKKPERRCINKGEVKDVIMKYSRERIPSMDELKAAEKILWRQVQLEVYAKEFKELQKDGRVSKSSSIYVLDPFIDENGILRLNGRLNAAEHVPEGIRNPIILPPNHHVTNLLLHHFHVICGHQWHETVICKARENFWIPSIRRVLRKVTFNCNECKLRRAKPCQPRMGQLPYVRLEPYLPPWSHVALDYFGWIEVTVKRSHVKRWVALFGCMTTRAVHCEIAEDCSTDSFILCLRNFMNTRGQPRTVSCDNGTNFRGFDGEIKDMVDFFDWAKIKEEFAPPKHDIEWRFNVPADPSAGGAWERLVQSVKRSLKAILKEQYPREAVLRSCLLEATNIVNSRPLTHVPVSHEDEPPLTPNTIIIGHTNSTQTPSAPTPGPICERKLWKQSRELKNRFWHRWLKEYLPTLVGRSKWHEPAPPLQENQLVIICDPNTSRNNWQRGKIIQTFPAADGQVRSAIVKTPTGLLRRPANKLAVLNCEPTLVHQGVECCAPEGNATSKDAPKGSARLLNF